MTLHSADDITVVIPAAGRVPEGVLALGNVRCPAMIPVGGRPVIHWTLTYLRSLGLRRFVIAVSQRGLFVEDFVESTAREECDIRFIVPSRDGGVGLTIKELLDAVTTPRALVVLGDTHFQFEDPAVLDEDQPLVLTGPVQESYRWCVVSTSPSGIVQELHDKVVGREGPLEALIGVYYFPSADGARRAAADAVDATPAEGRTEIASLLGRLRAEAPIRALRSREWLDCGNPDQQASSHQKLLQARAFNELRMDGVFGTITKRSHNVAKLIDEINFLRLLPPDLQVLFPRVLEHSTSWKDAWVRMEYYGYPTLSEIFVFENVDAGLWERIFRHLRDVVVDGFMNHRKPASTEDLREVYVSKTSQRLAALQGPPELKALVDYRGEIVLNGRVLPNLPLLWERLEAEIERMSESYVSTVIHGDLCFGNILYDLRSRICKFLDPRGSFGQPGIFGDPRYDVAKLYHSVHGLYDFITHDLFRASLQGAHLDLAIRSRPHHEQIRDRFDRVFFPEFARKDIVLISALCFASMLPLHYDAPQRQIAMYARAMQLLDESLSLSESPQAAATPLV
jgi:dTDP-glucose pyrophosphorylase